MCSNKEISMNKLEKLITLHPVMSCAAIVVMALILGWFVCTNPTAFTIFNRLIDVLIKFLDIKVPI